MTSRALRQAGLAVLLPILVIGCGIVKTATEAPGRLVSAVLSPGSKPTIDGTRLARERLTRYADLSALELKKATLEFARRAGTPAAQEQALTWWIDYSASFWRLASGPQPFSGLFDTLLLVSTLRRYHESSGLEQWGDANEPLREALRGLEANAWSLAGETMDKTLLDETREILTEWLDQDGSALGSDVSRLPDFVDLAERTQSNGSGIGAYFSLDPLSGLEPAVREVEQVRQLSERALYYMQRMPELIAARTELLVLHSVNQPEIAEALAGLEHVAGAATSIAATAESLPAALSAEREAALIQISAELTAQREGLVHDLETSRAPLVELLSQTRATAEAGREMSQALTLALGALDAFVGRFDDQTEVASSEPPARPFDVREYGEAAEKIARASRDLSETIATLDRNLPEVERLVNDTLKRGEDGVDHAFTRGLQLLVAALLGTVVTVLTVRRLSPRETGRRA